MLQLWPNMACELQRSDETRLDNWSMLAMALSRNAPLNLTKEILQRTVPSVFVQVVHALSRNSTGLLPNQHQLVAKISINRVTSRLKGGALENGWRAVDAGFTKPYTFIGLGDSDGPQNPTPSGRRGCSL